MEEYFKKFADDLEKREKEQAAKKSELQKDEDNWQARDLNKKLRENPHNRTTWSK